MAFQDFAETQYIKTIDTGEEARIGTFSTAVNGELKYIRLTIFVVGTSSVGTDQVRVNIYSESTFNSLLFSSDWSSLSDISGLTDGDRWLGWLRVDFDRQNINKNLTYYPTIEMQNYTRNAQAYYVGFAHDFPFPIYDNSENLFYDHPLQTQLFHYVLRSDQ